MEYVSVSNADKPSGSLCSVRKYSMLPARARGPNKYYTAMTLLAALLATVVAMSHSYICDEACIVTHVSRAQDELAARDT
jgi:hypothetical protein